MVACDTNNHLHLLNKSVYAVMTINCDGGGASGDWKWSDDFSWNWWSLLDGMGLLGSFERLLLLLTKLVFRAI